LQHQLMKAGASFLLALLSEKYLESEVVRAGYRSGFGRAS